MLILAGGLLETLAPFVALGVMLLWSGALLGKLRRRRLLAAQIGIEPVRKLAWRDFE